VAVLHHIRRPSSVWLFNVFAEFYAWFTGQAAWRQSCARLAEKLEDGNPDVVVDLGCGPGVSTFALARSLPRARLVGLDIAPRMLHYAQHQTRPGARIEWVQADAARLPLSSASVAACTGHSFLYLVSDRASVLREVRRVLRPGGQLVFMEPSATGATPAGVLAVSRDPRHLVSVSLWRPMSRLHGRFTPASLVQTLMEAGFVDCTVDETIGGLGLLATGRTPAVSGTNRQASQQIGA
jgi:ubiquinone/menaquinone biosynthesis C-methylase UbiE